MRDPGGVQLKDIILFIVSAPFVFAFLWFLPTYFVGLAIEKTGVDGARRECVLLFLIGAALFALGLVLLVVRKLRATEVIKESKESLSEVFAGNGILLMLGSLVGFWHTDSYRYAWNHADELLGRGGLSLVIVILLILTAAIVYLLPTIIASYRKHHNVLAIFFANLLLGWTGIGWVAVLIWSGTAVRSPQIWEKGQAQL